MLEDGLIAEGMVYKKKIIVDKKCLLYKTSKGGNNNAKETRQLMRYWTSDIGHWMQKPRENLQIIKIVQLFYLRNIKKSFSCFSQLIFFWEKNTLIH